MAELIQPEINRTFLTGSGNWTGALNWSGNTLFGRTGYLYFDLSTGDDYQIISLLYPYVKPLKLIVNQLSFSMARVTPTSLSITYKITLTDGVKTFSYGPANYGLSLFWEDFGVAALIPSEWISAASQIIFQIKCYPGYTGRAALRNFSLTAWPPTRPDHLPLMGVH